jgi:CheY-specific phosphatase CheX
MILGNFKETMESHTGPLSLSVPTVVYGKNFSTRTALQAPWVIVPFQLGDEVFQVRVCIKRR